MLCSRSCKSTETFDTTYCSGTFCCSIRIKLCERKIAGKNQLPPHTKSQQTNAGRISHQRRRRRICQYSSSVGEFFCSSSSMLKTQRPREVIFETDNRSVVIALYLPQKAAVLPQKRIREAQSQILRQLPLQLGE